MSTYKLKAEGKRRTFILKPRINAQQLQDEIDDLALLLDEVKKKIEKIEAAADAIGDAVLFNRENDLRDECQTTDVPAAAKAGTRIRNGRVLPITNREPQAPHNCEILRRARTFINSAHGPSRQDSFVFR